MLKIKNLSLLFSLLLCLSFLTSCGDDDDDTIDQVVPTAALTTYTGFLTYTSSNGDVIINEFDGTATVAISGSEYNISFSDDAPSIDGLVFIEADGSFVTTGTGSSTAGISIIGDVLAIGSTQNGNNWAFSGSR